MYLTSSILVKYFSLEKKLKIFINPAVRQQTISIESRWSVRLCSNTDANNDSSTDSVRAEEVCQHTDKTLGKSLLPPLIEDVPREEPRKR
jgi:hypothetical protein